MNKRLLGIIVIAIGLIVLIGIVYFIFFYNFSQPQEQVQPAVSQQTNTQPVNRANQPSTTNQVSIVQSPKKTDLSEIDLKRMAESFAERFGSYSNQSNYGNISDLKIFMSSRMQAWADDYINQAIQRKTDANIYYGITTKAIASEIKQYDNDSGQAEILVKTQRREATGTTANASSFYQEITIKFIKENGVWKVNDAFWQTK